jgi:hypothetical protein
VGPVNLLLPYLAKVHWADKDFMRTVDGSENLLGQRDTKVFEGGKPRMVFVLVQNCIFLYLQMTRYWNKRRRRTISNMY